MKIAIVGGGIGGLCTAVGLHKIGIKAHIYEQASSFKPLGAGIGIGSNAMLALSKMGLAEDIIAAGMPLHEQRFLNGQMKVMNAIDFGLLKERFGEENIAIQRADLHQALYDAVDPAYFHFGKKVTQFTQDGTGAMLTFNDEEQIAFDYVIAADGIHSIFRQTLLPGSKPRYAGYTCWRGITRNAGDVPMHLSQEAWSTRGRIGWAPLKNGDVYWFACVNAPENDAYYNSMDKHGVARQFAHFSKTVERIIAETDDDYFLHHDIHDIKPLNSYVFGRVILLGDAAHATTPNMGQGAGQAVEDAYELMCALREEPHVADAFLRYDKRRLRKTRKVIQLSRQIGWAAQWDHPFLVGMRDKGFPFLPKSLLFKRLTFLFK